MRYRAWSTRCYGFCEVANWRRKLSRPVHVSEYGTLTTLEDARHLVLEVIPPQFREQPTWQHVAAVLLTAADGGDVLDATISLELALTLAGVRAK